MCYCLPSHSLRNPNLTKSLAVNKDPPPPSLFSSVNAIDRVFFTVVDHRSSFQSSPSKFVASNPPSFLLHVRCASTSFQLHPSVTSLPRQPPPSVAICSYPSCQSPFVNRQPIVRINQVVSLRKSSCTCALVKPNPSRTRLFLSRTSLYAEPQCEPTPLPEPNSSFN